MTSHTAIHVEGLGKSYRLGQQRSSYSTLRESVAGVVRSASQGLRRMGRRGSESAGRKKPKSQETIWALKDVSFEVPHGQVVGIIGRNGAGKSTLLKILSRITDPTTGFADIAGRVGSLLEVGTGFHAELSGRENVYLNGAILGMQQREIARKFDEIVDFAGVERFIDTAVKHYSSGMYLRLAFAVAAHLEPEILLVDEVLAVGDASFQQKCLGRMEAVSKQGRTVLFVSHNMGAVRSLCTQGIVLDDGQVIHQGEVNPAIAHYFRSIGVLSQPGEETGVASGREGFGRVHLEGNAGNTIHQSQGYEASTVLKLEQPTSGFYLFCILEDLYGGDVFHLQEASPDLNLKDVGPGEYRISVKVPPLWLVPGLYSLHFKAMLWGATQSRFVSDKFPLDISGNSSSSNSARCLLHPGVTWDIARD